MCTYRAYNGSGFTNMDVAAVCAFPDNDGTFLEYFAFFYVFKKFAISCFVFSFDFAYAFKAESDFLKAFSAFANDRLSSRTASSCKYSILAMPRIHTGFPHPCASAHSTQRHG